MNGRKINVLHLLNSSLLGGTETMVATLINNSSAERYHHVYAFFGKRGEIAERLCSSGHKVISLSTKSMPGIFVQLYKILITEKIDVLYSYGLKAGLFARMVSIVNPHISVIQGQRSIDANRSSWEVFLDRVTSSLVDLYVPNCQAAADMLVKREKIPISKVKVIYNGLDITKIAQTAVIEEHKKIDIVCVANLRKVKGHIYILRALSTLKELGYQFHVNFIGGGPLLEELKGQAEMNGVGDNVTFLGVRRDVYEILLKSDIFVLGSLWEGFPVSIMEAMACNLPVIASNVGGVPELVIDGHTGFLVPSAEPMVIAQKMKFLIEQPEIRKQMGSRGRERIISYFSVNEMVRKTEEIIEDLATSR